MNNLVLPVWPGLGLESGLEVRLDTSRIWISCLMMGCWVLPAQLAAVVLGYSPPPPVGDVIMPAPGECCCDVMSGWERLRWRIT